MPERGKAPRCGHRWRGSRSEFPENGAEKPDKEDERDDDGEVFSPLFVAEALLIAALTLSLGLFIPFFEVKCHG